MADNVVDRADRVVKIDPAQVLLISTVTTA
jgi:hypothetical protein